MDLALYKINIIIIIIINYIEIYIIVGQRGKGCIEVLGLLLLSPGFSCHLGSPV